MITDYQRKLMTHTVSNPERNWFATSLGCENSIEFEKLVLLGLATKETPPSWIGSDVIYRLTAEGKNKLNEEGI